MMARVVWSPLAQVDLDDIWEYSFETWGLDQAELYLEGIRLRAQHLLERHVPLTACDDIRKGYFRANIGSHIMFFVLDGGDIDVKRILHQSMDFQRHL